MCRRHNVVDLVRTSIRAQHTPAAAALFRDEKRVWFRGAICILQFRLPDWTFTPTCRKAPDPTSPRPEAKTPLASRASPFLNSRASRGAWPVGVRTLREWTLPVLRPGTLPRPPTSAHSIVLISYFFVPKSEGNPQGKWPPLLGRYQSSSRSTSRSPLHLSHACLLTPCAHWRPVAEACLMDNTLGFLSIVR